MHSPRTLVIGDIHGALRALEQLLGRVQLQPTDRLIFLGDYVDGWSESAAVIEYLMRLEQTQECIFLRGNHDVWCAEWLRKGTTNEVWLHSGGQETIKSFEEWSPIRRQRATAFFENLLPYFVDTENRLFIHAGFASMHGPTGERHQSNCWWDRTLWETALALDPRLPADSPRYPKRFRHFKEIFLGHTPTTNYGETAPMQGANVWNVDTGAAFQGRLSALDADTNAYWQSEPAYQLYPNEKGRN